MWMRQMNGWTLRIAILVEFFAGAASAFLADSLLELQRVSRHKMAQSPDATFVLARLLMHWGIASGRCIGLAIAVALSAAQRRREATTSPVVERLQWAAAAVPVLLVAWTARGL